MFKSTCIRLAISMPVEENFLFQQKSLSWTIHLKQTTALFLLLLFHRSTGYFENYTHQSRFHYLLGILVYSRVSQLNNLNLRVSVCIKACPCSEYATNAFSSKYEYIRKISLSGSRSPKAISRTATKYTKVHGALCRSIVLLFLVVLIWAYTVSYCYAVPGFVHVSSSVLPAPYLPHPAHNSHRGLWVWVSLAYPSFLK